MFLELQFSILTYCCLWLPRDWESPWLTIPYKVMAILVTFLIYTLTLSEFLDVVLAVENYDDLAGTLFMLLSFLAVCTKVANALKSRRDILDLTEFFLTEPCKPFTEREIIIQRGYDKMIRKNTIIYGMMIESTVFTTILKSLLFEAKNKQLLFRAWYPYNYTETWNLFGISYFHQTSSFIFASLIDIAYETLICGFMLQICAQFDILKSRLQSLLIHGDKKLEENSVITNCVKHHNLICKCAKRINEVFNVVIVVQFLASSLLLCTTLYQILQKNLFSLETLSLVLYLNSLFVQIFIYCWYGNEVLLYSYEIGDAIYQMDWTSLQVKSQKSLITMMNRSMKPIQLTTGSIISLNIGSFTSLLKLSYSAFNLLQKMQT